jgi:hypothetical protein
LSLLFGCLPENLAHCLLDGRVLVIQMNKDIVDCVLIERTAPGVGQMLEKDFKDLASFNPDSILRVI